MGGYCTCYTAWRVFLTSLPQAGAQRAAEADGKAQRATRSNERLLACAQCVGGGALFSSVHH